MTRRETTRLILSALVGLLAPAAVWAHKDPNDPDHHDGPPKKQQAAQPAAAADDGRMYRWQDDRGRVHYSQGLQSVPEEFRATAVPLGQAMSPATQPRKP